MAESKQREQDSFELEPRVTEKGREKGKTKKKPKKKAAGEGMVTLENVGERIGKERKRVGLDEV